MLTSSMTTARSTSTLTFDVCISLICWLQMHSGAVYCQLVDAYCKSVVAMSKVTGILLLQPLLICLQHNRLHS